MAYTAIDDPEAYFQVKLYSGNNSDGNAITLDADTDMQPDLIWSATRNNSMSKRVYDSVRGINAALLSDTTAAEDQYAAYGQFESFDSDGFTVGVGTNSDGTQGYATNTTGHTYAAWCWKAGTAFSNDQSATGVGSFDSTASINTTSGISILSYTGNDTAGATVAHGLGAVPKFIIVKDRGVNGWKIYHVGIGAAASIWLDDTAAAYTHTTYWNDTTPGSSVITLGSNDGHNNSDPMIAYVFADVQGFSKFGSYEGNANADGTFVNTGFRPAFVMTKSIDSTSAWHLFDNKREGYNVDNDPIEVNEAGVEATTDMIDILSNGFKLRIATDPNVAETYIYAAFAEAPFVNSNGVPCNAR
jgi:hypothetical protein